MKQQIADLVRTIDELNRELAEHWSKAQRMVAANKVDETIVLLNAYFRLRTKLTQVESSLESLLKSQFAGQ